MRGNKAAALREAGWFCVRRRETSTRKGYAAVDRDYPFPNAKSFNLLAVRSIWEINIEIPTKRLDKSKGTTSWKFILQVRRIETESGILKK